MPCAPPWWPRQQDNIVGRTDKQSERDEVLGVGRVDCGDSADPHQASQLQIVIESITSSPFHNGAERLQSGIEIKNKSIVVPIRFALQATLHLNEGGIEGASGCLGCSDGQCGHGRSSPKDAHRRTFPPCTEALGKNCACNFDFIPNAYGLMRWILHQNAAT